MISDEFRSALKPLEALVEEQANDEGLWFAAQTAPEAYLQQELRKLHAAIERLVLSDDVLQGEDLS